MRTEYRNGDPIDMPGHYCNGCDATAINGVPSHERGCPEAWRDGLDCRSCGAFFFPGNRYESTCPDCVL